APLAAECQRRLRAGLDALSGRRQRLHTGNHQCLSAGGKSAAGTLRSGIQCAPGYCPDADNPWSPAMNAEAPANHPSLILPLIAVIAMILAGCHSGAPASDDD